MECEKIIAEFLTQVDDFHLQAMHQLAAEEKMSWLGKCLVRCSGLGYSNYNSCTSAPAQAFLHLGLGYDQLRNRRLLPLLEAEMARRAKTTLATTTPEEALV